MAVLVAFAAARLAHCRARLALSRRRDRHRRAARQSLGNYRGQIARRSHSSGQRRNPAAAPTHQPRRRSVDHRASRSWPPRYPIRSDAGSTTTPAAALARRLAPWRIAPTPPGGSHRAHNQLIWHPNLKTTCRATGRYTSAAVLPQQLTTCAVGNDRQLSEFGDGIFAGGERCQFCAVAYGFCWV